LGLGPKIDLRNLVEGVDRSESVRRGGELHHSPGGNTMRYALLICDDEQAQLARGVLTGGERLRPTTDATSVRVRDGEVLASDGPFAETKEQIGGFYLVDCKNLDEAIEVASKIPAAENGVIEVRPIWEM
jgi:hypothetical protein